MLIEIWNYEEVDYEQNTGDNYRNEIQRNPRAIHNFNSVVPNKRNIFTDSIYLFYSSAVSFT